MKVLTITLLACAVTVIQPIEAQCKCIVRLIRIFILLQAFGYNSALFSISVSVVVTVDFAQRRYAIAEGNNLTVEVRTNLEEFPLNLEVEFNVTVRVKEDLRCTRKTFDRIMLHAAIRNFAILQNMSTIKL